MRVDVADQLRGSAWRELAVALGSTVLISLSTWWISRRIAGHLHGKTRFGLRNLDRLTAPITMLVAFSASLLFIWFSDREPPILSDALVVLMVLAGGWFGTRVIDVVWATATHSARVRGQPVAITALLVGRHLGKLVVGMVALTMFIVRLGGGSYLYLVLAGSATAVAFAARDPIRNAVAFLTMTLDPPFRVGDKVRFSDYRSGQETVGDVTDISLSATTIHTRANTLVTIANVMVDQLRIENLSAADRRRMQLEIPINGLSAEAIRTACENIEHDLRESPHLTRSHVPRVWITGVSEGLRLKASMWLRATVDRRTAQRDVLLAIHARLHE
jgi:small-conductance mechanosensitive channel